MRTLLISPCQCPKEHRLEEDNCFYFHRWLKQYFIELMEIQQNITNQELWKMKPRRSLEEDDYLVK